MKCGFLQRHIHQLMAPALRHCAGDFARLAFAVDNEWSEILHGCLPRYKSKVSKFNGDLIILLYLL